jgi:hypothetical protein
MSEENQECRVCNVPRDANGFCVYCDDKPLSRPATVPGFDAGTFVNRVVVSIGAEYDEYDHKAVVRKCGHVINQLVAELVAELVAVCDASEDRP